MYVKSYNQTHDKDSDGNDSLGCQYETYYAPGYDYRVRGSLDYSITYSSMYCGKTTNGTGSKTGYWWLASPSSDDKVRILHVDGGKADLSSAPYDYGGGYAYDIGICPIVSLKSSFTVQIYQ